MQLLQQRQTNKLTTIEQTTNGQITIEQTTNRQTTNKQQCGMYKEEKIAVKLIPAAKQVLITTQHYSLSCRVPVDPATHMILLQWLRHKCSWCR